MKIKLFLIFTILFFVVSCNSSNNNDNSNNQESYQYNVEEFFLYEDSLKIYGNLYTPLDYTKEEKRSIVIMSHSANCNSDTLKSYAINTTKENYLAYTFDFPGGSTSSRSDKIDECTIFSEEKTLTFIVNYFKNLQYIDNIYLSGTSQGGLVSALVGDSLKEEIEGLILFYPAFNIPELIVSMPYGVSNEYVEQLRGYDVYSHIGKFEKDVLIEHGSNDFIVDCSYSEKAAKLYKNCSLHIISGANHGFNKENFAFNNNYDEKTWGYVKDYLNSHS